MDVIHLFVFFKHWCHAHYLNINVIHVYLYCLDMVVVSICVVYTQKSCTWFPFSNNAQHSHLNNMNLQNNKFHMDLKWTHEAYKFVMYDQNRIRKQITKASIHWSNAFKCFWKFIRLKQSQNILSSLNLTCSVQVFWSFNYWFNLHPLSNFAHIYAFQGIEMCASRVYIWNMCNLWHVCVQKTFYSISFITYEFMQNNYDFEPTNLAQ